MPTRLLVITIALLAVASPATAHDIGSDCGLLAGLAHPVLGFDHLLAMLSVGLLSAQMGGAAIWSVPATFVGVMFAGGVLGLRGAPLPSPEAGIALSVAVLGIALAAKRTMPPLFAMVFVGFFALFHGYAHGAEMPALAEPVAYVAGFVLGTAMIHGAGVLIGLVAERTTRGVGLLRYVGAGLAGVGIHMLILMA